MCGRDGIRLEVNEGYCFVGELHWEKVKSKKRKDKTQAKFLIKKHLEAPSFFCKASESLMQKLLRKGNYPKKKLLCSRTKFNN